ncbi:MAG: hypothetical protein NUK57_12280 [Gudongella sp.]|nr:hypothetical protein [Gudongella sp.]
MKNPYVPEKKIDIAIINKDATSEIFQAIESMGIRTIPTIETSCLPRYVANHPDMVLSPLPDGSVVAAPSVWEYYNNKLENHGIQVRKGWTDLEESYPKDVPYNVTYLKDTLIHRLDVTDGVILDFAEKLNLKRLNIRQGYSKCSLVIVDESSGITSDSGIFKTLSGEGFDVLLIKPGYIRLPGFEYGFIGGATGLISQDKMAVTGNLDLHPDKYRIEEFLTEKGISLLYLTQEPAIDIGTIIGLCSRSE